MSGMVEIPFAALAPFACRPDRSKGRQVKEPPSPTRSPFQRDRDRVLHSTAFRRLKHKTQVFVFHEGDHYRTRLTHSLEVAQIARSITRVLGGNEDLAETVALAHDLGHPPFGHVGERVLSAAMAGHEGFDHNAQTVRIVTSLERRYAGFDGLNLTWETLEGLAKHNGPLLGGGRIESGLPFAIRAYPQFQSLELDQHASLEAQIAAISDDIAYINHDIDDGLRADLFTLDDLCEVPFVAETVKSVWNAYGGIEPTRRTHETLRRLISTMIDDVIDETTKRLKRIDPTSAAEIRAAGAPMAGFSEPVAAIIQDLKTFLFARMYRSGRVNRTMAEAEKVIRMLFRSYMDDPKAMPEEWRGSAGAALSARARTIADFIAGMTDRYAIDEFERLTGRDANFE